MRVSVEYAQQHLGDLLAATDRGEDVEIERAPLNVFRLEVVQHHPQKRTRSFVGALRGQIWIADDFKSEADSNEMAEHFENSKLS